MLTIMCAMQMQKAAHLEGDHDIAREQIIVRKDNWTMKLLTYLLHLQYL